MGLHGKRAVVTGSTSGIGLGIAEALAAQGAEVVLNSFTDTEADHALAADLGARHGVAARYIRADMGQGAECRALVDQAGGCDILVNNAGQGRVSTFADTSDEAWTEELHLKLFSLIHPTRAFVPLLERSAHAAIVCVNSLLALQPEPHMVATSAARAGAQNLVRSMATEFAPKGIRVNAILIGLVESGQWQRRFDARDDKSVSWPQWTAALAQKKGIQLGRLGKPEEAAQAIFHLATPASSYTTGSHIDVSGGLARHI